jgi:phospholipid/cholesterol/gamma-HCH transport system permease protein
MYKRFDEVAIFFGAPIRNGISDFGAMIRFLITALTSRPKISSIFEQMMVIGIRSLPIVIMATVFTGFIATWQVKYIAGDMGGMQYLGAMVLKAVLTELGPTLIGLVLAGRIGAKVAAEVGTMRVTEQLDAMVCLSLDPIKYSVAPRIYAGFIITPILFIYGAIAAVLSSQMLAWLALDVSPGQYFNSMRLLFEMTDIYMGLIKSFVFGGISALTGCYYGFFTTGGANGVGMSTRNAVVSSSILILVANLFISMMM